jgi:hypothetical protein
MKNVTLDRTTVLQLNADGTDGALDATADCDVLRNDAATMESDYLILRRASAFRPSGGWNDDDYAVLCNGVVVGRIMQAAAVPVGMSWMWTLAFGHHEATREAAMAAFAKSWRRATIQILMRDRG